MVSETRFPRRGLYQFAGTNLRAKTCITVDLINWTGQDVFTRRCCCGVQPAPSTRPCSKKRLEKYGSRAICVDDTFYRTPYSLRLATVVARHASYLIG
ncbi:hypothetical protein Y032_0137g1993 [Ancylostoma ceylanicum]|uniref:Uncharacterized protein n=1 Tax=Ancylostoma ceylanicum TaxID=53326 RepID=A0A016T563_9BILA|nr:hypothetical protein Y032_0137g1993 [Ancylostoma ceylanicum]